MLLALEARRRSSSTRALIQLSHNVHYTPTLTRTHHNHTLFRHSFQISEPRPIGNRDRSRRHRAENTHTHIRIQVGCISVSVRTARTSFLALPAPARTSTSTGIYYTLYPTRQGRRPVGPASRVQGWVTPHCKANTNTKYHLLAVGGAWGLGAIF